MSVSHSGILVQPSNYPEFGLSERTRSNYKLHIKATLNLKYKPGGYSYFYRRVRPVDHKLLSRDLLIDIVNSFDFSKGLIHKPELEFRLKKFHSLYFQIVRMFCALDFWERFTPGDKIMSAQNAFRDCILGGYLFADKIKRIFQQGMRVWHSEFTPTVVDDMEYKINNYNAIPPYWYFVLWQEPLEDYKYMLEDPVVDDKVLAEFEEVLSSIIPDSIDDVPDAALMNFSSSASRTYFGDRIKMNHNMTANTTVTFNREKIKGFRTIIPISPANWRDAVTLDISSYFTMRKVDLLVLELLDKFETSVTAKRTTVTNRRLRRLKKYRNTPQHGYYVMRDIKKSGLTMPIKQIGPILRKVLTLAFPGKGFELIKALENMELFLETSGQSGISVKRGLGLGMGNNIWTLIQCCVFELLRKRIDFSIDGLFGNDDSVIHIPEDDSDDIDDRVFRVIDEDQRICKALGIILSDTKTFVSREMVFYEEYTLSSFKHKESKYICNLGVLRVASCIFEAKMLASMITYTTDCFNEEAFTALINHWGYEFFPEESLLDYRLGGWLSNRKNGLSYVLHDIYKSGVKMKYLHAGFYAATAGINIPEPEPSYDFFSPNRPHCDRLGIKINKSIPKDKTKGISYIFLDNRELSKYYDRINSITSDFSKKFRKINAIRHRVYKKYLVDIDAKSLSIIIRSKYNDCSIPEEEVHRTTREYDLLSNFEANPMGTTEETQHITLCKLHDEGYIEYKDRYIRYLSYKSIHKVLSDGLGRIQPDVDYKEYSSYCNNVPALLYDWMDRFGDESGYPDIPTFYEGSPQRFRDEDDIIINEESNIIVPLKYLYLNFREHVSLDRIIDANNYLREIEQAWLERLKPRDKQEEEKITNNPCSLHDTGEPRNVQALLSGILKPYFESEECKGCRDERDLYASYLAMEALKNKESTATETPLLMGFDDDEEEYNEPQEDPEETLELEEDAQPDDVDYELDDGEGEEEDYED